MRHIDKLMLSTSTLVLESVPGNVSDRPRAVRFEAGVGDEIIDFEPAVFLEGKVNKYVIDGRGPSTFIRKGVILPSQWPG